MESLLIFVNIVLAVILVIIILLQRSEGGALGLGVSQTISRQQDQLELFNKINIHSSSFIYNL